jgi:hypothetical protein
MYFVKGHCLGSTDRCTFSTKKKIDNRPIDQTARILSSLIVYANSYAVS